MNSSIISINSNINNINDGTSSPSVSSSFNNSFLNCQIDHSNRLLYRLNLMRNDETMCDYEIRVNGQAFWCHKCVLIAMSDFFKAMLTGSMKESKESFVDLKGLQSTVGITTILNYLYTGCLNLSFENIDLILDTSSHLQINDIIQLCCEFLINNLNVSNCVSVLKLADRYSLKNVIEITQHYLNENIFDIYENSNEQFYQLTYEQIKSLLDNNDSLQMSCTELDLFLILVKWLDGDRKNENNRLIYASSLMKSIRFMCMSPEELADQVESVECMKSIPECRNYLLEAYKYHALPKRQPIIRNDQTKLRNQESLVAVGETNIFILNELKQKWEVVCQAPLDENYPYPFSVITINNYLYVLGSRQRSSNEEYRSCHRFSPRTLEWTPLAPLLRDRSRFGIAVVNDYIYIWGGFEGFKRSNRVYLSSIDRYSIAEDRWEQYCSDGPLMSSMASCSNNNLIYFGGGKNTNWSKISDFYTIDVETKKITKKANLLSPRTTHQLTYLNDKIYVLGGFDDTGNGILTIESYDIQLDQWTVVTQAPGLMSKTWPQCLGVINNKFYISVFHTPNTFKIMQKGYYYDLKTNVWSEAPVINERARYCPTCCLAFPKRPNNKKKCNDFVNITNNNDLCNN